MKLFLCIISLLFLVPLQFCAPGGVVRLELSEKMVGSQLERALQQIDPSLKVLLKFKRLSANVPKFENFKPEGEIQYILTLDTFDLYFDSLEGAKGGAEVAEAVDNLRSALERNGINNVAFSLPTLVSVKKKGRDVIMQTRVFPERLKIMVKGESAGEINTLLEFLKKLIITRVQEPLLKSLSDKYLKELSFGELFTLRTPDLQKTKTIEIEVKMGNVNSLNPLRFRSFSTSKGKILIEGVTVKGATQ